MSFTIDDLLHPFVSQYMASPQWVKTLLGSTYTLVPRKIRFGRTYPRFKEAFDMTSESAINQYRLNCLSTTLQHCINTVPAFSSLSHLQTLIESDPEAALLKFPIISKSDLKANLESYCSNRVSPKGRLKVTTGGSTAVPMHYYLEKGVGRSKEWAAIDVMNDSLGLDGNEIVLALRGRSVPNANLTGSSFWMYEPIKRHLILSNDHLEERYMPLYVQAMKLHRPTRIAAFASALYPLARWFKDHPDPAITNNIRGIVLTSESTYDFQIELFEQIFRCPIIRQYGHSERVVMGYTKLGDNRYHFVPQYGWLELVDSDGTAISQPGILGEIVGTSFDNRAMPFIRYRTGDLAMLAPNQGAFANGAPICSRIDGRVQEFVVCHDQRLVSITTLGAGHFEEFSQFEQLQYEQFNPGHLILRLQTPRKSLGAQELNAISKAVADKLQGGCEVSVELVPRIDRTQMGKLRMLIQHLPLDRFYGSNGLS